MVRLRRSWIEAAGMVLACSVWGPVGQAQEAFVAQDAEAVRSELARFQGSWQLLYAETDGVAAPAERLAQIQVRFEGSSHTVRYGDQVVAEKIAFRIDPTRSPSWVEDRLPAEGGKESVIRGIYQLDGDLLISCVAQTDGPRPTAFDTKPQSGQTLRIFRRIRSSEDAKARAIAAEFDRLAGVWQVESRKLNGRTVPPTAFTGARLTLQADRFRMAEAAGELAGFNVIDPTTDPKRMDVVYTEGSLRGQVTRAIYRLGSDTYTFCFPVPNHERPTRFDATEGSQGVDILKRVKP